VLCFDRIDCHGGSRSVEEPVPPWDCPLAFDGVVFGRGTPGGVLDLIITAREHFRIPTEWAAKEFISRKNKVNEGNIPQGRSQKKK
jgi:hypothetical protein